MIRLVFRYLVFYFSFSAVYRIGVYALIGIYAMPIVMLAAVLCVPYLSGIWLGARLFARVSDKLFLRLSIGLVFAAGVVALLK